MWSCREVGHEDNGTGDRPSAPVSLHIENKDHADNQDPEITQPDEVITAGDIEDPARRCGTDDGSDGTGTGRYAEQRAEIFLAECLSQI